jgi:hypothetical protein
VKIVYILLVFIIAASTLGCVSQQPSGTTPAGTSVSPTGTPASDAVTTTPSGSDQFGTQSDINAIDSVVNDSSMDIPLSDVTI